MMERLKAVGNSLGRDLKVYRSVLKDKRTPTISKIALGLAVGYALLPFDLIPDWIPVIGHLDDVIIVPLLVIIGLKFMPKEIIEEYREKFLTEEEQHG